VPIKVETRLPNWSEGYTANWAAKTLTAMAKAYAPWYVNHPLPPLYGGRIVYRLPPNHGSGTETFANPWEIARRGWTDCDGATCYRLTELFANGHESAQGFAPRTRATWAPSTIHVLVRIGPGDDPEKDFEDPSLILLAIEALRSKR